MHRHAALTRPATRRAVALLVAATAATALSGCSGGTEDVTTVPDGAAGGAGEAGTPGDSGSPMDGSSPTGGDSPVTPVPAPSSSTSEPRPEPTATGSPVQADLTVVVDDGTGTSTTYTLTCDGEQAGGTLPSAAEACAQLADAGVQVFAEPPADQVCTEIYGGPQTATITGTFAAAPVQATLARTNGCEISRWNALSALVGPAGDPDV